MSTSMKLSINRSALFTAMFLASLAIASGTLAQEGGKKFPEGVGPSDVYATVDLLNRSVDTQAKGH